MRNTVVHTKFQSEYMKGRSNWGDLTVGWKIILKTEIGVLGCALLYSALDGGQCRALLKTAMKKTLERVRIFWPVKQLQVCKEGLYFVSSVHYQTSYLFCLEVSNVVPNCDRHEEIWNGFNHSLFWDTSLKFVWLNRGKQINKTSRKTNRVLP